jgi:hypothetical protein
MMGSPTERDAVPPTIDPCMRCREWLCQVSQVGQSLVSGRETAARNTSMDFVMGIVDLDLWFACFD